MTIGCICVRVRGFAHTCGRGRMGVYARVRDCVCVLPGHR